MRHHPDTLSRAIFAKTIALVVVEIFSEPKTTEENSTDFRCDFSPEYQSCNTDGPRLVDLYPARNTDGPRLVDLYPARNADGSRLVDLYPVMLNS